MLYELQTRVNMDEKFFVSNIEPEEVRIRFIEKQVAISKIKGVF